MKIRMLTSVSTDGGSYAARKEYDLDAALASQWVINGWAVSVGTAAPAPVEAVEPVAPAPVEAVEPAQFTSRRSQKGKPSKADLL